MLKTIIIDDEKHATERIERALQKTCQSQVEIIAIFNSSVEALKALPTLRPDLLFLDVQMPIITGFELLKILNGQLNASVIFVSGYQEYAIKAFQFNATDYILKPDLQGIAQAVQRIIDHRQIYEQPLPLSALIDQVIHIPISLKHEIHLVAVDQIMYCIANNTVTNIYLDNKKVLETTENLGKLAERLNIYHSEQFFRIHNSYIVQRKFIESIQKGENVEVKMRNNYHLKSGKTEKRGFSALDLLQRITLSI
ncbi:MAG: response regulator [Saprospiraceae bacterium]|nr:response regulator [Saprospiraceae bacterium]